MVRVLVAASNGLTNQRWIGRCIRESLGRPDLNVALYSEHAALSSALLEMGYTAEATVKANAIAWRSSIRSALDSADYLLLLWDGRSLTELLFEARLRGLPIKLHVKEVAVVVNKDHGDPFDVYIGRGTPWGNPYPVGKQEGQYEREEAIELFRKHFEQSLLPDPSFRRALLGLRGQRLACHCKPLACHGDVIASYLNALDEQDGDELAR